MSVMLSDIHAQCHIQALYAECHYAECLYAECRGAFNFACLSGAFKNVENKVGLLSFCKLKRKLHGRLNYKSLLVFPLVVISLGRERERRER